MLDSTTKVLLVHYLLGSWGSSVRVLTSLWAESLYSLGSITDRE